MTKLTPAQIETFRHGATVAQAMETLESKSVTLHVPPADMIAICDELQHARMLIALHGLAPLDGAA